MANLQEFSMKGIVRAAVSRPAVILAFAVALVAQTPAQQQQPETGGEDLTNLGRQRINRNVR